MPSKSKAQQRLMGMALAAKRGKEHYSGKVKEVAEGMSEQQLHDFAKTKSSDLPEKKASMNTEQAYINGFVKRASEYGYNQQEALEIYKQAMGEISMANKKAPAKLPVKVPNSIKGNANDVANMPPPVKPLRPDEMY